MFECEPRQLLTMLVIVWLCSRTLARPTSASLACLPVRSSSTLAGFTSKLITCKCICEMSELSAAFAMPAGMHGCLN